MKLYALRRQETECQEQENSSAPCLKQAGIKTPEHRGDCEWMKHGCLSSSPSPRRIAASCEPLLPAAAGPRQVFDVSLHKSLLPLNDRKKEPSRGHLLTDVHQRHAAADAAGQIRHKARFGLDQFFARYTTRHRKRRSTSSGDTLRSRLRNAQRDFTGFCG